MRSFTSIAQKALRQAAGHTCVERLRMSSSAPRAFAMAGCDEKRWVSYAPSALSIETQNPGGGG